MAATVFWTPEGDEIENPTPEYLKEKILQADEYYWSIGSGQGWITFRTPDKSTKLVITFDPTNGFCLEYRSTKEPSHVSIGQGDFEHTVSPQVGGDPWLLPTKFFVSRKDAWQALSEFLMTGERTSKINWAVQKEIDWQYGY